MRPDGKDESRLRIFVHLVLKGAAASQLLGARVELGPGPLGLGKSELMGMWATRERSMGRIPRTRYTSLEVG